LYESFITNEKKEVSGGIIDHMTPQKCNLLIGLEKAELSTNTKKIKP